MEANVSRAKIHYGTSQDDELRLAQIINHDFGGVIDLAIDDASHFYDQTKASFKVAFPKVRPGGLYIIEDWTWSFRHTKARIILGVIVILWQTSSSI